MTMKKQLDLMPDYVEGIIQDLEALQPANAWEELGIAIAKWKAQQLLSTLQTLAKGCEKAKALNEQLYPN
jgi:hypothetical protein